ncbi:phenylalanine--tRNA ligase subunit alpha [archaeon]|nr:phenylalanine--tRNA ligase subunit alpha [archaeon]
MELSPNEKKVLIAVKDDCITPEKIAEKSGLEMVAVMSASSWLKSKGLVEIKEKISVFYSLDIDGKEYLKTGLPEKRILNKMENGKIEMKKLFKEMDKKDITVGVGYLKELGGVIQKGMFIIEENKIDNIKKMIDLREKELGKMKKETEEGEIDKDILNHFKGRKDVLKKNEKIFREIFLTDEGKECLRKMIKPGESSMSVSLGIKDEIGQITPELIQTGKWKEKKFRRYDVNTFAKSVRPGKIHPLTKIINEIRFIFVSMGFREIEYDYVQPCLWNMDALFVPQDHPARDMQDTFYVDEKIEIDKKIAKKIKEIHETGGNTGSEGWGTKWSMDEAEKTVLRTHTTVNSIRYLSEHPETPLKVFTIGRNFRRENIDSTHLPEFTQIEGIVSEENADFNMLVGILKEFYKRIGFEKIRIKPSYFPFTEPSLEVLVEYGGKMLEMGGAGIFRPEVTAPFNVKYPVLAWGLGLERLAMIRLGLKDIRQLYMSDIEWLRKV